ncbi:regulatory GntR family protein [Paraburkholderia caballeronis]|nr:regulatory GntR family protein [Paraburkholderia caballeronis]TDV20653.1 regulatory GntR family protein [Paraburkholderia caballeronis]TDV33121.1 regulatory GntR family protein [Paraburkholderia caballeronis]
MNSWPYVNIHLQEGPAYRAIVAALEAAIRNGDVGIGDLLPSQRLMADFMGVHVNTVNRAMREAARLGLTISRTRLGTVVVAKAPQAIQRRGDPPCGSCACQPL